MTGSVSAAEALARRFKSPGSKRILSIDGGGVRGALSIGMLSTLERLLRERTGRPEMVLSDYFDLIGGTSTGAIIAAGLAQGRTCANLDALYNKMGARIFGRSLRIPLMQARFDPRHLQAVLEEELGHDSLGDAPWRTGFAAMAKRVDTGSPWVLTNCAEARYWNGDPEEIAREPDPRKRTVVANRDFPVARIVQASAAAPFFFDLVQVEVMHGQKGIFFDGAISPHNNPALQLAMTAIAPAYGLGWKSGGDNLMIVSLGTGAPRPRHPEWVGRRRLALWKAMTALMSVTYDSSQLAISMLQWLGQSPQPWPINAEIGTLTAQNPQTGMWVGTGPGAPAWTYLRYDAPLEAAWQQANMGRKMTAAQLKAYARLDGAENIPALIELGVEVGEALIKPEHFRKVFDREF